MTDADLFNALTASLGGRFPREIAPDAAKAAYAEIAERANDLIAVTRKHLPNLPAIYFDFIANSSINAVAFKAGGRYFIGINTGTIFMLRSIIGRIFSDSRLFRRIGDPDKESNDLTPLLEYSVDADELLKKMPLMTPRDSIRASYAWFLQDQAIMFLIGHEIAHITRGHVDYLASNRNIATKEIEENPTGSHKEIIQRQSMEVDADASSIYSRIDSLRITFENPTTIPLPWAPGAQGPGQLIQDWGVSLNVLFNLFGNRLFTLNQLKETNHPTLLLRQAFCNGKATTDIVRTWDRGLESTALISLTAAQKETNEAFATLLGLTLTPIAERDQGNISDYGMQLIDEWNSHLRFSMKGYAYEF
ncbi:M48 family metalloprotease [Dyadobacter sp. MSC1_007]|jgi:hypothetical protein|uniref:M48 family metalloprotease n=1 Tax=Dyadobacter sp. MSC1_007 TaxID=2909264 RepID=UPI0020302508|nr:M48 family metalloprotease [Dyadobacter sp. MSC1_007]